ncbi:restriction endonuclease subunit S [Bacillus altitudinis]|uniref:restriction endonuclease subunit S n=1 Tax=Bacillus altitudinis TaxID=293387 RepID=UPI00227FAA91|nr:restriction endonuclease subunit S [Bacillus altitudinis]MCY7439250.1 restriction endonuclease subunit S [Bacillus altitudinis]MEC1142208.1 restriction endonuclease subunit S [Bacillus altitudinis]
MTSKWKIMKLGDVINLKRGYDLPNSKREIGVIPIMSSSGNNGYHNEAKVIGPGVITGRSGQLGKVFYVEDNYWPLNTTLYVEDFKDNHPKYVYYLLQTLNFEKFNAGSSVPTLNRNHVHQVEVKIPNYKEQKSISNILYTLDKKIQLNEKMRNKLEQLSQTFFKHWFIDFEFPNEEGQPYKSSGGKMVESELGHIPNTFSIEKANNKFNINIGKTPSRKDMEMFSIKKGVIWASIADLKNQTPFILNSKEYLAPESIKKYNIKIAPKQTVLLSFKLTVGRVAITTHEMATNEAIAHFTQTKDSPNPEYTYLYLKNFNYESLGNTSSIAKAVNSKIIKNMVFLIPDNKTLERFNEIIKPLFKQMENLQIENIQLQQLRDTLLPKLLSGEIELPDELEV